MTAAASSTTPSSRWADLPPDLLGDVAGRLRDAADLVRLHAICTPWRDSLLSLTTTTRPCRRLTFPPWPLVPCKGMVLHSVVDLRRHTTAPCCRNKDVVLAEPPGVSFAGDNNDMMTWVASADGTGVWLFTNTRLLNVFTGAVTRLPRFREHDDRRYKRRMENLRGIVYSDGTVFLYSVVSQRGRGPVFTAAILHAGDTAWTFVKTRFHQFPRCWSLQSGATYHDGKILVCVSSHHQFLLTLKDGGGGDYRLRSWRTFRHEDTYQRDSCYVLESRGELFLVSVLVLLKEEEEEEEEEEDPAGGLRLMVQALEEEEEGVGKMRWVERDGRQLLDRILFLGYPASFAADAVPTLGMDGGCAYFVFRLGLFRYNLVNGEAKLVKRLNNDTTDKACIWLQPQLAIAPIHEIRKRMIQAPNNNKKKKQKTCPIC